MNGISTHVLDTSTGQPAPGVPVHFSQDGCRLSSTITNADGRCAALLPAGFVLSPGIYGLTFEVAAHFPDTFYPEVTISFQVRDTASHYHVPLLISPFGYTTYRGS